MFLEAILFLPKCCEICTEAIENAGANTFSAGGAPKTGGFFAVICIIQFWNILALFDKVMVSKVCMSPNGDIRG